MMHNRRRTSGKISLQRVPLLSLACTIFFSLLASVGHASAADPSSTEAVSSRALIAFDKDVSGDLVAGRNVTVVYDIRNVGGVSAFDVSLRDASFPASRFDLDVLAKRVWAKLPAGENVTHVVNVSPKRAGDLFVSPASVTYSFQNVDGETVNKIRRVSKLSSPEFLSVEDLTSFRRRTDKHTTAWLLYSVAFFLLGIAPFAVSDFKERSIPKPAKKS